MEFVEIVNLWKDLQREKVKDFVFVVFCLFFELRGD